MDAARRAEAQAAVSALLEDYRDVLGPQCWCGPPGDEGDEHEAPDCPSVPSTVGLGGWVLTSEWPDLADDGLTGTAYLSRRGQSPNLSRGLHDRARKHY